MIASLMVHQSVKANITSVYSQLHFQYLNRMTATQMYVERTNECSESEWNA